MDSFSRATLTKIINMHCQNKYNFLYLPMDQATNSNLGYGYINMIDLDSVALFYEKVGDDHQ